MKYDGGDTDLKGAVFVYDGMEALRKSVQRWRRLARRPGRSGRRTALAWKPAFTPAADRERS